MCAPSDTNIGWVVTSLSLFSKPGYNDVSWHNRDILSPNLARLASEGILLESFYAQSVCSPSRAALMTGRYAIRTGVNEVLHGESDGLSANFTLLPEHLGRLGYSTHIVGK